MTAILPLRLIFPFTAALRFNSQMLQNKGTFRHSKLGFINNLPLNNNCFSSEYVEYIT